MYLGLAAAFFVAGGSLLGGHFLLAEHGVSSAEAAVVPSNLDSGAIEARTRAFAEGHVRVQVGARAVELPWSRLGITVDRDAMAGAMPVTLDRARAVEALEALKQRHDRGPKDARMDLEQRTIHRDENGLVIDVYGSLGAIEEAARSGADTVALRTVALPADVTVETLGIDDISHVLAQFETKYAVNDQIRNYNLKLAASKLNGYVLKPGEEFSFNEAVGPRTEKEGYKVAGVITAGEMVDGLAGGTCQISSTLHGAAFFAGLDLVRALPHSRPSTYVEMGLDATVVYPHVDLRLRNNYDFPVTIHFRVAQGRAVVEILGRERPFDEVVFEREVVEKLSFDTVTREDDTMPVGSMMIDQYGFYGYVLDKVRKFYKDGKLVKRDKWKIRYQPVTEYVRTGINPDPNLVPPKAPKKKKLREPDRDIFRLSQ
jgi:vancomycin resistance protein YoaR